MCDHVSNAPHLAPGNLGKARLDLGRDVAGGFPKDNDVVLDGINELAVGRKRFIIMALGVIQYSRDRVENILEAEPPVSRRHRSDPSGLAPEAGASSHPR